MTNPATVRVTIAFIDPDLDQEDLDIEAQRLVEELRPLNEIESVSRVSDPLPPANSKALGGFLIGLLTTEINGSGAEKLLDFLKIRLANKPIELTVEANGKKLSVKAHSQKDLKLAIQAAQDFISA